MRSALASPKIPKSLQPKTMGAGGAITVAQQKDVKKYGSVEAAKTYRSTKARVEAELKKSGIENSADTADYEAKYNSLSQEVKQYVQTPTEYKVAVKQVQTELVETNKPLIAEKINYYKAKLDKYVDKYNALEKKYKKSGDTERATRYDNKGDEYEAYYKGIISSLEKSYNVPSALNNILSYAKDVGKYKKELETYRNDKKAGAEPEMTIKMTTTAPAIISYVGGKETVVEPSKTTTKKYYKPEQDYDAIQITDRAEVQTWSTPGGEETVNVWTPTVPQKADLSQMYKEDKNSKVIIQEEIKNIEGYKPGEFMGQGTRMFDIPKVDMPTKTQQYIRQNKNEDELAALNQEDYFNPSGIGESSVFTYDYGQGTPSASYNIDAGELEYDKPNTVVETSVVFDRGKEIDDRKAEITATREIDIQDVSFADIQASTDNRGFLGSVLHIGPEPEISGADYSYAMGKKSGDYVVSRMQQDYDYASKNKADILYSKIKEEDYQKRIDSGEDYKKVQAELDAAYAKANKEMSDWTRNYEKEWAKNEGKNVIRKSEQLYFDAQLYGAAKDRQGQVLGQFLTGAGVSAAIVSTSTVVNSGLGLSGAAIAPVGMVVGAGVAGFNIGKSVAVGEQTYDRAKDVGFIGFDAVARGALGGATELAPFAYTAAGSLTGAFVVGGALRYARRPDATFKKYGSYKEKIYKISGEGEKSIIGHKGERVIDGKVRVTAEFPKQMTREITIPGQRTITSQRWRHWVGAKPVSTGYPSDTTGQVKAIKLWKQYGLSNTQAKELVQFVQPQIITETSWGYGYKADAGIVSGSSFTDYKWLDVTLDKKLGVTTKVKPTKSYDTTFSRGEADISLGDDTRGFIEISHTQWTQGSTGRIGSPTIRAGISVGENIQTTVDGKIIKAINIDTSSRVIEMGSTQSRVQDSSSYFIKSMSSPNPSSTSGTGYNSGDLKTYYFKNPVNTYSMKLPMQALQHNLMDPTSIAPTTNIVKPSLIQIAPPSVNLGLNNNMANIVQPKLDTLSPLSIMFSPGLESQQIQSLSIDSALKEQELDSPILFDVAYKSDIISEQDDVQRSATRQDENIDNNVSPVQEVGLINNIQPRIPDFKRPATDSGNTNAWINDFNIGLPRINRRKKVIKIGDTVDTYDGYVMVKGNYKKVAEKKPKSAALDAISRIVDNTISAQGKIKPTGDKKKVTKENQGDGYYEANKNKFRGFRISGGKKIQMKDTIIEKKNKRLDTIGETSGMTVAQFNSRDRKISMGMPVRKSKKKKAQPYRL